MSRSRIILLVQDSPDDVELTLRGFEKSRVVSKTAVVTNDGEPT